MRQILLAIAAFLSAASVRGDVVYNNLSSLSDGDSLTRDLDNSPHIGFAQQFVTSGPFSDLGVILNLFKSGSTTGTFTVKLMDNNSGVPSGTGLTLGTGNWNDLGTSRTNQFSLSAVFAEKAQGTYWLAVIDNNPSITHRWAYGSTRPYNSPISGNPLETAAFATGFGWANLGTGFPLGAQIATPEPGTLLLGGIAALSASAGYFWKRRRNQPRLAQNEEPSPETTANSLAI